LPASSGTHVGEYGSWPSRGTRAIWISLFDYLIFTNVTRRTYSFISILSEHYNELEETRIYINILIDILIFEHFGRDNSWKYFEYRNNSLLYVKGCIRQKNRKINVVHWQDYTLNININWNRNYSSRTKNMAKNDESILSAFLKSSQFLFYTFFILPFIPSLQLS